MKTKLIHLGTVCLLFLVSNVTASVLYVDLNSANPVSPYADWSTAATNIQDAIDASSDGDQIWVTNGIYQTGGGAMAGNLTNRVVLNKAVTVQSVNGPFVTVIQGAGAINGTAAVRCAWLTNNAALIGFTLTGGATQTAGDEFALESGGGVWCASSNATVANCVIVSNTAYEYGGGAYQGTLNNCLISSNSATTLGGGGTCDTVLKNCTVINNVNLGIRQQASAVSATNCIIYFNAGGMGGNYAGTITFSHCCTTPAAAGIGNFTNNPQFFVDGIHLASTSPCIGAGTNSTVGTDIFGDAWANPPSIGCVEAADSLLVSKPQIQLTGMPVGFVVGNVSVAGQAPFTFQWLKDDAPLQDNGHFSFTQTTNLVAAGVSFADAGSYQLIVSNAFGVVTSAVVQLVAHCVDAASANPVAPYSTWTMAATNIQDAITAAAAGDIVFVTNGCYAVGGKSINGANTNRVAVDKAIIVQSANGAGVTIIQGAWDLISTNGPDAVRCAYVTNGATLSGFTLQNGATGTGGLVGDISDSGGGAFCNSTNAVVSNCILTNNSSIFGGGICGGTYDCAVRNSIVVGNFDSWQGGFWNVDNYYYDSYYSSSTQYSCSCTSPRGPFDAMPFGTGNINAYYTNVEFLDLFHIASTSPCRGAGSTLYASGTDLDGEPWNNPPSMGCDEVIVSNLVGPLTVNLFAPQTNVLVSVPGLSRPPASFYGIIAGRAAYAAWSFGDGPTFTNFGADASHQWTNTGDYTVTFTAYNNDNPAGVSTNTIIHVVLPSVPQLQSPALLTNGFQFQFPGQFYVYYTIQYATNLMPPVQWQTLQTINLNTYNVVQIEDAAATNTTRFYRVLAQ